MRHTLSHRKSSSHRVIEFHHHYVYHPIHYAFDSMYLTQWTLLVSSLYIYPHFILCLSPALDSIYYTLHALDSVFIVTLCLSSIIIHVILSMASYGRTRMRGNSNFTSRSHARPRQSPQRVAQEPCNNPKSSKFTSRSNARLSTTPIPAKGCGNPTTSNFTSRSHANPRKGLRGNLA